MPSFISDLWIFSKDGLPLIEVFNNDKINSTLLGAFLSAIESFSFKLSGVELKSINLGQNKFILTLFGRATLTKVSMPNKGKLSLLGRRDLQSSR